MVLTPKSQNTQALHYENLNCLQIAACFCSIFQCLRRIIVKFIRGNTDVCPVWQCCLYSLVLAFDLIFQPTLNTAQHCLFYCLLCLSCQLCLLSISWARGTWLLANSLVINCCTCDLFFRRQCPTTRWMSFIGILSMTSRFRIKVVISLLSVKKSVDDNLVHE